MPSLVTRSIVSVFFLCFGSSSIVSGFAFSKGGVASKPTVTSTGLQIEDLVVGEGKQPGPFDFISVHYDAKIAKGNKVFDSSRPERFGLEDPRRLVYQGEPIQFQLGKGKVIAALDEGLKTMNVGGKRRLRVPSELGYGKDGFEKVPPNADLIFDVELVSIDNPMSGQFGSAGNLADGFKIAFGLIAINGLTEFITGHELREYINNAIR